jgi:uncharacterized membrane protein
MDGGVVVGFVVVVVVLVGATVAVREVTRAAARGTLRPNQLAGMRTPATLASPEAWQAAHRAAQPVTDRTASATLVAVVAAVAAAVVGDPGWAFGLVLVSTLVLLAGTIAGGVVAHREALGVRKREGERR